MDYPGRRRIRGRNAFLSLVKRFILSILFIVFLTIGAFFWWKSQLYPVNISDTSQKKIVIESGEGIRTIADKLHSSGLIRNQWAFILFVKKNGLGQKIQAGEFHLSPSMTAKQIAEQFKTGTFDVWITIPEGKRAEEIADILQNHLPNYQENWRETLIANEGYLFPSKYRFPRDTNLDLVIKMMKKEFDTNYSRVSNGQTSPLTKQEIATIASLVEREAKFAEDRPLVASVIINRLNGDIRLLNIDATIQYALGYQPIQKTWWKKHLTASDLELNTPYNTYIYPGLPPTPIANAGFDVLSAVVNAPDTDYWYYISDETGHNHYAKTLEQHNENRRRHGL